MPAITCSHLFSALIPSLSPQYDFCYYANLLLVLQLWLLPRWAPLAKVGAGAGSAGGKEGQEKGHSLQGQLRQDQRARRMAEGWGGMLRARSGLAHAHASLRPACKPSCVFVCVCTIRKSTCPMRTRAIVCARTRARARACVC